MSSEPTNDQLRAWDREYVWHAFSQMSEYEGLIIQSGEGCWVRDIDGREYLDGVSNLWCNIHGHNHPVINRAVEEQLHKIAHVTQLGMSHPTTITLAKRLCDLAPVGLNHVFFSSDGASAIEAALKMAFQYWRQCENPEPERKVFVAVASAYHGDTIGTLSLGDVSRFRAAFDPLLFPVIHGPCPDLYRLPEGVSEQQACDFYLGQYRQIFERLQGQVVALVVEPIIQGAAGMIVHPVGFLSGLRKLTLEFDILLIADEVAVGMGRTGKMFACQHEEVAPDLLCLGKGLTGGYLPMAATLTSDRIWSAFLGQYQQSRTFYHGHTYGGNPLAAAAALATLDLFEAEQTLAVLPDKSQWLADLLKPLQDHEHVGDIRQRGLMAAIELVQDKPSRTSYPWSQRRGWIACQAALTHNVWLRPLVNVIAIVPPLCLSHEELEIIVRAIEVGIQAAVVAKVK